MKLVKMTLGVPPLDFFTHNAIMVTPRRGGATMQTTITTFDNSASGD